MNVFCKGDWTIDPKYVTEMASSDTNDHRIDIARWYNFEILFQIDGYASAEFRMLTWSVSKLYICASFDIFKFIGIRKTGLNNFGF